LLVVLAIPGLDEETEAGVGAAGVIGADALGAGVGSAALAMVAATGAASFFGVAA